MPKKTAFVHCRLMPGGGRKVFLDIIADQKFDEACIFTLISRESELQVGKKALPVICSLPQWICKMFFFFQDHRVPFLSWLFDYRNLMFFYPSLMKLLSRKLKQYRPTDVVISSFAIAKNITIEKDISSILYLHSPNQYIHSHFDEYLSNLSGIKLWLFRHTAKYIQRRDQEPRSYTKVFCNSYYTAEIAKLYYNIDAKVVYPAVNAKLFSVPVARNIKDYFVYVGRVVSLVKELDRLIRLFNKVGEKLIIIGSGPDEYYLKKIASDNILFVGRIDDDSERNRILREARGLINITKESFGLSTAESLLLGVPVFGYAQGASKELIDDQSGVLVESKDDESLEKSLLHFCNQSFDRHFIQKRARRLFSDKFSLSSS